jgi:hypothetical protein
MELSESIKAAWAAVEESGIPDHMQELAFREALRNLLGTSQPGYVGQKLSKPTTPSSSGDGGGTGAEPDETLASAVDEAQVMSAVSEHFGISADRLEQVFHVDAGVVKLTVNHTKLGASTADKTRTAAQVVTVVRKVGMGQADTPFDIIRAECERKHHYDSKNFVTKHLPNIPGFVIKGDGKNRRLEAKGGGIAAFPALIDKILGES